MFESPYRYESGIRREGRRTPIIEVCQSCGCDLWSEYEVVATLCVDCIDLANTFVAEFMGTPHVHTWAECHQGGDFEAHGWPCAQCVTCGEFGPLPY